MTPSQMRFANMKNILALSILCLAFGSKAFAQEMSCSHELLTQTFSEDGLAPETADLLAKIEKVAGGSLTSQSFSSTLSGPAGPNGETKFYFANDSDASVWVMFPQNCRWLSTHP